MFRVLITDPFSQEGLEVLKAREGIEVELKTSLSPEEIKEVIKNYDALLVRSGTKVTRDIIEAGEKLKVIGRAGIGVDNIDLEAATKRGIVVMNAPEGNTITTAEHAISLMLSLARNIPQAHWFTKEGQWERERFSGTEVYGKTLGIIGLGRIGSIVADRAIGLKMSVIGYDPYISEETVSKMGVEPVELNTLLERSDFISLHIPLTNDTRKLLDKKAFRKVKRGVKIINCARGGIINESDLCEAIKDGIVSGAAIDVFETEPPKGSPLLELEEVIVTPHLGAYTDEAQVNVAVSIAEQVADFLLSGTVRNAVNVPPISGEVLSRLRPYLNLAERMGNFLSQISPFPFEEIQIEYGGEIASFDVAPITPFVLAGLLKAILGDEANVVNVRSLSKERGIKIVESKTEDTEDFTSLVTVTLKAKKGHLLIAGTIFGKNEPRIVKINNFRLEVIPEGYMLVIYSHDRPGVIGNIGTVLGRNEINIGRMQFGREEKEGKSLILLNTDTSMTPQVLAQLMELPFMISVKEVII